MKVIENLETSDAQQIFNWYFESTSSLTNADMKAKIREFLKERKQSPEDCIREINKEKSQMPQSKSF